MRDQWYGDDRDLVKWGGLLHLAHRESMSAILYVAMYRADAATEPLLTGRGPVDLPAEVLRHFRDIDDIQRLARATGLEITVHKDPMTHRRAYFARVATRIQSQAGPMLVFLDPDIGLVSEGAGPEHVASADVSVVFDAMREGDLLVCYQHARRQKDWRGRARRAFANAPGIPAFEVEAIRSDLARDVLLLAVKKETRG